MSNYATKSYLKNAAGVATSQFGKKDDLANLKSKVDKLNIDKLAQLDVDKLEPVLTHLKKLSNVVKNDAVKKDVYDAKIKHIEDNIPSITNLDTNAAINAKINEVKNEIPTVTSLAANTAFNA